MKPINTLSGNICNICGSIITTEPGNHLLCPKCQETAMGLLFGLQHLLKIYEQELEEFETFKKNLIYLDNFLDK